MNGLMAIKRYAEGGKVMSPSAFKSYIYEGGRDDTQATARGLEYLASIGANPAEGVDIFNQALGTKFGLNDFLRVADEFGYKELSSGSIRPKSEIENTFEERIYQGLTPGVDDDFATLRGLQIAQQAGLTGQETVDLFNSALGFESGKTFTLEDIPRVETEMTERLGAPVTIPVDKPIPKLPTKVGVPGPGGLSNLTALNVTGGPGANINQTGLTAIPRTDFSKLAPELRMAGQYSPLLAAPTGRPGLDQVTQRLDQGTQRFGAAEGAFEPLYAMPTQAAAPTAEEAFRNYIYAGGADPTLATTRGLQYARNLGLTPEQATALFNRSLGTEFGLADYDRVMAENAGLFPSMPQPSMTQVIPTGITRQSPITGGLATATAQGGIGANKYYENIAGALNQGLDPNQVLSEMSKYGITTDDLIAARARFPTGSVQALGSVGAAAPGGDSGLTGKDAVIENQNDEGAKAGGLISKYAGGPVTGSPQYFAEGGEAMTKYTPTELGSTFDVSEYIDPDTGRFMINEYRRDVVFNKGLEEAETEARARMTPEEREMAMRDLMIRQGRTGREYGLPGITVGGPATSGIRPLNYYAEGGEAKGLGGIAMRGVAEEIRQQGRNGDTILAHINPQEAAMLEAMGGSGTINPRTGLPEYGFSWKKFFKYAAPVLGIIGGPVLGLTLAQTALGVGALAGMSTPGKTFDFKRGLQAGIMTYAGGKLGEQFGATQVGDAAAATAPSGGDMGVGVSSQVIGAPNTGVFPGELGNIPYDTATGNLLQTSGDFGVSGIQNVVAPTSAGFSYTPSGEMIPTDKAQQLLTPEPQIGLTPKQLEVTRAIGQPPPTVKTPKTSFKTEFSSFAKDPLGYVTAPGTPATLEQSLGGGYGAYTSSEASDEAYEIEKARDVFLARKREEDELMDRLFRRTLGSVGPRYAAKGGLMALAGGGAIDPVGYEGGGMTAPVNQPRMLAGGGDGMSDSIPATIDGTQPARLADGEFVIPADVVADIGNGSSSAGAKRLYGMMDRVREARHGTTKQPPEIKMNRLMPA